MATVNQLLSIVGIYPFFLSFTLTVRSMWSISETNAFIRFNTAPFKGVDDVFLCTVYIARLICIFNAENKVPLVLFSEQITK
jgi:hypothetical protein